MTSEKSVSTEQRMAALVPRVGTAETTISSQTTTLASHTSTLASIDTDSWQDTAGMTAGWGKGSGFFKFRKIFPDLVIFFAQGLTCSGATVADDTTILSGANGFPSGYRPSTAKAFMAYTDDLKVGIHSGPAEAAQLAIQTGGSVQCRGIGTSATVLNCWGIFPTDI
jgi:hypothetical protein